MTTVLLPAVWLRKILKRKITWKIVLDYLKFFKKVQVSVHRLKFLRKCLKNDLIPDLLKFRVPENGFFSDQAVHNFQLKLLRTETSRANEDRKMYEEMLRNARSLVQKEIDKQWWAFIFRFVRRQVEASLKTTSENHRKKLEKLSENKINLLGGEMSDQLRYLIILNCLNGYMKCYQWAPSIQLETNLTKHIFWRI